MILIAKALGMTFEQFDTAWRSSEVPAPAKDSKSDGLTLSPLPIPRAVYSWRIAAGGWEPLKGVYHVAEQRRVPFGVKVAGDSMEPLCFDGDYVAFLPLNLDEDGPQVGVDYLIVRTPDEGTFKRLESIDGEEFTLRALNREKYPKPLKVSVQEIVLIAQAKFLMKDLPKV